MYCSASIGWHLLRGLAALACAGVALYCGVAHPAVAMVAVLSAVLLLRGCPMCWLFGLLERIRNNAPPVNDDKNAQS